MKSGEHNAPLGPVRAGNGSHDEPIASDNLLCQTGYPSSASGKTRPVSSLGIEGGAHGQVSVDRSSQLVCKVFRSADGAPALEEAQREYEFLQRMSDELDGDPYIRCPAPVEVEADAGRLWMTFCEGAQLHHALADPDLDLDGELEHIGEHVARAAERYVALFAEPYYALLTWNILFEPSTRVLSLVDVSDRPFDWCTEYRSTPVETTAGMFLGAAVYHSVRWRRASWRNQTYWNRLERLSIVVLRRFAASHDLCLGDIRTVSQRMYDALYQGGRRRRRLWFSTAGRVLFQRRMNEILGGETSAASGHPLSRSEEE